MPSKLSITNLKLELVVIFLCVPFKWISQIHILVYYKLIASNGLFVIVGNCL